MESNYTYKKITAVNVKNVGGAKAFSSNDAVTYVSQEMDKYEYKYKYNGMFCGNNLLGYTIGYSYYVPQRNGVPFHRRYRLLEFAIKDYKGDENAPKLLLLNVMQIAQSEGCCMVVLDLDNGVSPAFQTLLNQAGGVSNGNTCCLFLPNAQLSDQQKMLEQQPNHVLPWEEVWFLQRLGFEIHQDACTWKNKDFFISVCRLTGNVNFCPKVIFYGPTPKLNNNAVRSLIHLIVTHVSVLFPSERVWVNKRYQTSNGMETVDVVYGHVAVALDEKGIFKRKCITPAIKKGYEEGELKTFLPYSVDCQPKYEWLNSQLVLTPIKLLL